MSYIKRNLLKGESILFSTNYHWIHFISWISLFTLGIYPYIQTKTDEFIITNRRVFIKKGFLGFYALDISVNKVESINVKQGIFGMLLGYGCITVVGTGGTKGFFSNIKNPKRFRKCFMELI